MKQRRVDADEEPLSSVQSKPKDSYDFDSDLKAPSLSLPAPEVSHPVSVVFEQWLFRVTGNVIFIYFSCSRLSLSSLENCLYDVLITIKY